LDIVPAPSSEQWLLGDSLSAHHGIEARRAAQRPHRRGIVRYSVSAYENSEIPKSRWLDIGTFDSAVAALECARGVIHSSLEALHRANPQLDADGLRLTYLCYGEVPSIVGESRVAFSAYRVWIRTVARSLTTTAEGGGFACGWTVPAQVRDAL
jgi:hypothetical protein